jgi:hypothetical protein
VQSALVPLLGFHLLLVHLLLEHLLERLEVAFGLPLEI